MKAESQKERKSSMHKYVKFEKDLEKNCKAGPEFTESDLASKGWIDPEKVSKIDKELAAIDRVLIRSLEEAANCRVG